MNLVTAKLPLDRLLASDIDGKKGAITTVVIGSVVLFFIVLNQLRVIRKTGWLFYYAAWYIVGGLVAVVLSQLPGLVLRFHHYIAAIVLIPGTAFPTRLSAIYQGFLLGMFLNGVAAFDFASILQTAADVSIMYFSVPIFNSQLSSYNAMVQTALRFLAL